MYLIKKGKYFLLDSAVQCYVNYVRRHWISEKGSFFYKNGCIALYITTFAFTGMDCCKSALSHNEHYFQIYFLFHRCIYIFYLFSHTICCEMHWRVIKYILTRTMKVGAIKLNDTTSRLMDKQVFLLINQINERKKVPIKLSTETRLITS